MFSQFTHTQGLGEHGAPSLRKIPLLSITQGLREHGAPSLLAGMLRLRSIPASPTTPMPMIRASEVGEYVFCARAWWLRRVAGVEPPAGAERRAHGTDLHARHGRTLALGRVILWLGLGLFVLGLVLLVWA